MIYPAVYKSNLYSTFSFDNLITNMMKFKYLKQVYLVTFLSVTFVTFGQQSNAGKIKEIYLSGDLLKFQNLGLQYKTQIKDNTYFRIGLAGLNIGFNKSNPSPANYLVHITSNISGSFDIGLEKRRSITEALTCFYGINLYNAAIFNRNKTEDPTLPRDLRFLDSFNLESGFGFNSGLVLKIFKDFSISVELSPRILYKYNSSQSLDQGEKVRFTRNGGSIDINNVVQFSLIYSWTKL
jgi:hypothetical protein